MSVFVFATVRVLQLRGVKRKFDIFVWVCARRVIMCFYQSVVPCKHEYGGGNRGSVIRFIKKQTIPTCHWFHLGAALHNNTAFILACTIMNLTALMIHCISSSRGHALLTHKYSFLLMLFMIIIFCRAIIPALDTSIYCFCWNPSF